MRASLVFELSDRTKYHEVYTGYIWWTELILFSQKIVGYKHKKLAP